MRRHFTTERIISIALLLVISVGVYGFAKHHRSTDPLATGQLLAATVAGDLEAARRALAAGADPNASSADSWTALTWATHHYSGENRELTTILLAGKANPDLPDGAGQRPMIGILKSQTPEAVRELLAAGADPNSRIDYNIEYLDYPAIIRMYMGMHSLAELKPGKTPVLSIAVIYGGGKRIEPVRALLESGADPNRREPGGLTPLHWAVVVENFESARLLLDHGAQVDPNGDEGTPLYMAVSRRQLDIARLLLDHDANPNGISGGSDRNPLAIAVQYIAFAIQGRILPRPDRNFIPEQIKMVSLLVEHGGDPDLRGSGGQTPRQIAEANSVSELTELFNRPRGTGPVEGSDPSAN